MKDQEKRAKSSNKARAKSLQESRAEAFVSAEKWLEHLEEEIEPTCLKTEAQDLELVLKNSPEDLETLETLKRVRAAVKGSGDVALPESGHYYDALHSKIMAAIDTEIAMNGEPVRAAPKARIRRQVVLSTVFGALGMTMMVALLAIVGLHERSVIQGQQIMAEAHREAVIEEKFDRKIAMVDPQSGATFARDMGSFESEEDFLTETAAARLKQVSAQQADAMIRSLKR